MNKRSEISTLRNRGFLAGVSAYARGLPCVPAHDAELPAVSAGLPIGPGAIAVLQGWVAGWTAANLAAPVHE